MDFKAKEWQVFLKGKGNELTPVSPLVAFDEIPVFIGKYLKNERPKGDTLFSFFNMKDVDAFLRAGKGTGGLTH